MLASKSTTPSPMPAEPFLSPTTPPPDPLQRNATLPSPNTTPHSVIASSRGATTWLPLAFAFSCPPPPRDTPCPLCLQPAPSDHVLSCPLDPLLRAHYHRWIAAWLWQRCHAWRQCASTAWGVVIFWGKEPFLLAADGSPAHGSLPTYTVGRLGTISSPRREAIQHRGLQPANLRRLLCDVALTTILQHKRHAVPVLQLHPPKGGPCVQDPL